MKRLEFLEYSVNLNNVGRGQKVSLGNLDAELIRGHHPTSSKGRLTPRGIMHAKNLPTIFLVFIWKRSVSRWKTLSTEYSIRERRSRFGYLGGPGIVRAVSRELLRF